MDKPIGFRVRVMWLAMGMGLLLSLVFAAAAVLITERYEHVLVGALLQDQADAWAERLAQDPQATLPSNGRQRAHLRPLGSTGAHDIPPHLVHLTPGVHETEGQGDGLHIGVFDTRAGRIYLEVDLRDIEVLERYLLHILLGVVAAGALLSALLGWWLARSATRPLRHLANAVEQLGATPAITQLAEQQPRDELGRVAQAIDGYQQRLVEAQQIEQRFFADASHELRTPVAVVRGALELLEEDTQGQPQLQAPMQRLRRGIDETSTLLEALLRLARRQFAEPEPVDVDAWARDLLASTVQGRTPGVAITTEGHAGTLSLPLRDAELLISALARTLLAKPVPGTLTASLSPAAITLRFHAAQEEGPTATSRSRAFDAHARSDRHLGNSLLGRLATAHGWQIDAHDDGATRLQWRSP